VPDSEGNFTQYRARLHAVTLNAGKNAGTNSNIYYSFNQGLTHFIVFSAEAYLYSRSAAFLANQLAFMAADLAAVDRKATPWVVALVHKDWTMETEAYAAFYPILDSGKVDILFCGHVHYYNRYLPYDAVSGQTDNASVSPDGSVYTNPKYMVNIVTGASGDVEADDSCNGSDGRPSFACSENYGCVAAWGRPPRRAVRRCVPPTATGRRPRRAANRDGPPAATGRPPRAAAARRRSPRAAPPPAAVATAHPSARIPPPRPRRYGFYTALNATHATWSFKTVKADGPGPKDFSDALTIINTNHA